VVAVDIIDHDSHAVGAGAKAPRGHQLVFSRWRVHPDHTIADVQFAVHNLAGLTPSDPARAEAAAMR
jgi:hypothetical protein